LGSTILQRCCAIEPNEPLRSEVDDDECQHRYLSCEDNNERYILER